MSKQTKDEIMQCGEYSAADFSHNVRPPEKFILKF